LQNTANADITKRFKGIGQGLQVSFGGEFRYERYSLYAGEPNSYIYGGATLPDGQKKHQVLKAIRVISQATPQKYTVQLKALMLKSVSM